MTTCGTISKNLTLAECGNSVAGIEASFILMNFDDIDRSESTETGDVLSGITMKDGKHGYRYESHNNSFESSVAFNNGTYSKAFTHQVIIRVFSKTQEVKDQLNALAQGRVVAIVKNKTNRNPETKYEVYGWENGLEVSDFQAASTDADGVIYTITLASRDDSREGMLPVSFYAGSEAQTEAAIEALLPKTTE